jgi:hypothetical protein
VTESKPAEICVEVAAGTPGAVQAPNGKFYTGPLAHLCGLPAPAICVEVAAGTQGAVQAPNGLWYAGPNAHLCGQVVTPIVTPVTTVVAGEQPQGGALPAEKTVVVKQPAAQPQAAPQPTGVAGQQSPLRITRKQGGALPFTGAELLIFALVGAGLIASGLLLRSTARQKPSS